MALAELLLNNKGEYQYQLISSFS